MRFKKLLLVNFKEIVLSIFFFFFTITSYTQTTPSNNGCAVDFWKQNTQLWDEATDRVPLGVEEALLFFNITHSWQALTTELYSTVFNLSSTQMSQAGLKSNLTLLQALKSGGNGFSRLAQQSVTALLNAGGAYFPYSVYSVLTITQNAFMNGDPDNATSLFENANDGQCSLWAGNGSPDAYIAGQRFVCQQTSSLTFYGVIKSTSGPFNYKWSLTDNTAGAKLSGQRSGRSSSQSISINVQPQGNTFVEGGAFTLQLIVSSKGRMADTSYFSSIIISPSNNLYFIATANPTHFDFTSTNRTTVLSVLPLCGTGPYTYQWTAEAYPGYPVTDPSQLAIIENSTNATTTAVLMTEVVIFKVQVTDANGFVSTATVTVRGDEIGGGRPINTDRRGNIITSNSVIINAENSSKPDAKPAKAIFSKAGKVHTINTDIIIYPNPAKDVFYLQNSKGIVDISLINVLGVNVQRWNNVYSQKIDLLMHKPGMYTLLIYEHATGKRISKKVLISQ